MHELERRGDLFHDGFHGSFGQASLGRNGLEQIAERCVFLHDNIGIGSLKAAIFGRVDNRPVRRQDQRVVVFALKVAVFRGGLLQDLQSAALLNITVEGQHYSSVRARAEFANGSEAFIGIGERWQGVLARLCGTQRDARHPTCEMNSIWKREGKLWHAFRNHLLFPGSGCTILFSLAFLREEKRERKGRLSNVNRRRVSLPSARRYIRP